MQNGLVGHNRSVFHLELSQSDHYWGRYEWLQPKWVPNGYLGGKWLSDNRYEYRSTTPTVKDAEHNEVEGFL